MTCMTIQKINAGRKLITFILNKSINTKPNASNAIPPTAVKSAMTTSGTLLPIKPTTSVIPP